MFSKTSDPLDRPRKGDLGAWPETPTLFQTRKSVFVPDIGICEGLEDQLLARVVLQEKPGTPRLEIKHTRNQIQETAFT
eukprot:2085657-Rhodomonas_salina.2